MIGVGDAADEDPRDFLIAAKLRPGHRHALHPDINDAPLDRVVTLIIDMLDVSGCLLELFDETVPTVKAYYGTHDPAIVQDLLRQHRAARRDTPLILADARNDPVLADHRLVTSEMGIRFLALLPLARADGGLHGTLVVFSPRIIHPSPIERRMLTTITGIVLDQLELRAAFLRTESEVVRQRQLESLLATSRNRYRSVIDSLTEVIFQVGFNGRWRFLNRAYTTLTGEDFKSVLGQRALRRIHPADRRQVLEIFDIVRQGIEQAALRQCRYTTSDGSIRWCQIFVFMAQDDVDGAPVLTGSLMDVTDQRETEETLKRARDETERANRMRAAFLATVSHEIRTPINGVIGMTGLLLDTNLTQEQSRYTHTLRVSAEHLLQVINDILDYTKIDAGKMEFEHIPVRLGDLIDNVTAITGPRAEARGLTLTTHLPPHVPHNLIGDPGRIRQILVNLIGNAVKFTERGGIVLDVAISHETSESALLAISVTDTGIGIAESALPSLFKEFSQLDSSVARRFGGTGLGLAICKRLLDGMGGQITVESQLGVGSCFRFTLPLQKDPALRADEPIRDTEAGDPITFHDGGRILLAEDNATNQLIVTATLEKMGLRVDAVANGAEAVAAVRTIPYDLVLMDMQMPEMDGLEATRLIRQLSTKAAEIPIIGLTANAFKEDHDRCLAVGMQAIITKPFRWRDLAQTLAPYLHQADPSDVATPDTSPATVLSCLPIANEGAYQKLIHDVGPEAARTILTVFLRDTGNRITRMIAQADQANAPQICREAHALKGSVDMLGFERMTFLSSLLEMSEQEGASPDEIRTLVQDLKTAFEDVRTACAERL